jgi:tetratricopeptide (TPR) repeat protein
LDDSGVVRVPTARRELTVATFERATHLMRQSQLVAAREELERLLEREPAHVAARVTLGNLHLAEHRYEAAANAYALAHDHAPLLPEIHYLQAVLHKDTGQHQAALSACRRALFLDPELWPAVALRLGVLRQEVLRVRATALSGGKRAHDTVSPDMVDRARREARVLEALLRSASPAEDGVGAGWRGWLSCVSGLPGLIPTRREAWAMCEHHVERHRS